MHSGSALYEGVTVGDGWANHYGCETNRRGNGNGSGGGDEDPYAECVGRGSGEFRYGYSKSYSCNTRIIPPPTPVSIYSIPVPAQVLTPPRLDRSVVRNCNALLPSPKIISYALGQRPIRCWLRNMALSCHRRWAHKPQFYPRLSALPSHSTTIWILPIWISWSRNRANAEEGRTILCWVKGRVIPVWESLRCWNRLWVKALDPRWPNPCKAYCKRIANGHW